MSYLAIVLGVYTVFAFIAFTPNPKEWSLSFRALALVAAAYAAAYTTGWLTLPKYVTGVLQISSIIALCTYLLCSLSQTSINPKRWSEAARCVGVFAMFFSTSLVAILYAVFQS